VSKSGLGVARIGQWFLATRFLCVLVEVVHFLLVDRADSDYHDLNIWAVAKLRTCPSLLES